MRRKIILSAIFGVVLLLVIASFIFLSGYSTITGNTIKLQKCSALPYIYKIVNAEEKLSLSSTCSKYNYNSEQVCTDRSWFSQRCLSYKTVTSQECIEKTFACRIDVKNYENQVGTFGFKAYFDTKNGRLEQPIRWQDIYPQETEGFMWKYITSPNEYSVSCGVSPEHIPQKEQCS